MPRSALQSVVALGDDPDGRSFGSLFPLLLASVVLQLLVTRAVGIVSDPTWWPIHPHLVGTAVYASLGLSALAALAVAYRSLRPNDALQRHELVTLTGATVLFLVVAAYALQVTADLPVVPDEIVTALLRGVVGLGLPALVYARSTGIEIRFALPDRDAVPVVVLTVLGAALGAVGWVAAFALVADTSPVFRFGSRFTAGTLLRNTLLPGALIGAGTAVLYNGAIQAALRDRVGPESATAAVTALVGVSWWSLTAVVGVTGAGAAIATVAAVVVLSLVAAIVAVRVTRLLPESSDAVTAVAAASLGVLVAGVALLGASAVQFSTPWTGAAGISLAVAAAFAGLGYERSQSVWVPALGFAAYYVVVDGNVSLALARLVG